MGLVLLSNDSHSRAFPFLFFSFFIFSFKCGSHLYGRLGHLPKVTTIHMITPNEWSRLKPVFLLSCSCRNNA